MFVVEKLQKPLINTVGLELPGSSSSVLFSVFSLELWNTVTKGVS